MKSYRITMMLLVAAIAALASSAVAAGVEDYLHFDGSDLVVIPDTTALNPTQITIECWVNFGRLASGFGTSGTDAQFILCKGGDQMSGAYRFWQGWSGTGPCHLVFQIGPHWYHHEVMVMTPLEIGRWYHLAGTYDGEIMRFYLDGELAGEAVVGSVVVGNAEPLYLGYNDVLGFPYYLTGDLDEVRVWDCARTQREIQRTMSRSVRGNGPALRACYGFDEGDGQQAVTDSTRFGSDGTLGRDSSQGEDDPTRVRVHRQH